MNKGILQSHAIVTIVVLILRTCYSLCGAFNIQYGIGAILFQPKGLVTSTIEGDPQILLQASDFFVEAFWVGKVGGGTTSLSQQQRKRLQISQYSEFRGRYAGVSRGQSELIVCQLPDNGDVVGCAGVQVGPIPQGSLKGRPMAKPAPLMSNLAVSRNYRRKGIAEKLVAEVERVARYEWGHDFCYLYVEERNIPALNLYKKLGYRKIWRDTDAKTLLPSDNGNLLSTPTTLVCMRKQLGSGILGRLFPLRV